MNKKLRKLQTARMDKGGTIWGADNGRAPLKSEIAIQSLRMLSVLSRGVKHFTAQNWKSSMFKLLSWDPSCLSQSYSWVSVWQWSPGGLSHCSATVASKLNCLRWFDEWQAGIDQSEVSICHMHKQLTGSNRKWEMMRGRYHKQVTPSNSVVRFKAIETKR